MSLLVALDWWTSTAMTLVPKTSRDCGMMKDSSPVASLPVPMAQQAMIC
jgi:hypothetical protein